MKIIIDWQCTNVEPETVERLDDEIKKEISKDIPDKNQDVYCTITGHRPFTPLEGVGYTENNKKAVTFTIDTNNNASYSFSD